MAQSFSPVRFSPLYIVRPPSPARFSPLYIARPSSREIISLRMLHIISLCSGYHYHTARSPGIDNLAVQGSSRIHPSDISLNTSETPKQAIKPTTLNITHANTHSASTNPTQQAASFTATKLPPLYRSKPKCQALPPIGEGSPRENAHTQTTRVWVSIHRTHNGIPDRNVSLEIKPVCGLLKLIFFC